MLPTSWGYRHNFAILGFFPFFVGAGDPKPDPRTSIVSIFLTESFPPPILTLSPPLSRSAISSSLSALLPGCATQALPRCAVGGGAGGWGVGGWEGR